MESGFTEQTQLLALPSELPHSGRHYLLVFERDLSTRVYQLPANGQVIIGRGGESSLQLQDSSVSRRHARITQVDGRAQLVDLDSQNGTLVNRERVHEPRHLVSGDTIAVGAVTIVYHSSIARDDSTAERDGVRTMQVGERHVVSADPAVEEPTPPAQFRPLADEIRELEQARISAALDAASGNQRVAAQLLAMPLRTFVFKLKQYGMRRIDER